MNIFGFKSKEIAEQSAENARQGIRRQRSLISRDLITKEFVDIHHVRLEQVGGDAGDHLNPCTFTYNLFDIFSGQQLNESQGPVELSTDTGVRHTGLRHIAAKKGEAYVNAEGDWVLIDCNERLVGGEC